MTIQEACDKLTELCHQGHAQATLMFISGADVKEVENFEMLGDDTVLVRSKIKWPGPATKQESQEEKGEYVEVDLMENGKVVGTAKVLKKE
jgi:uncharacterized protein YuzE